MKYLAITLSAVILLTGCASAPMDMPDGEPTKAPYGYYEFCQRNPTQCEVVD